jgi:anti-sigma regulatory factor (Ser/Thr protein kinase)/CheY-like chemotaxis protein
MENPMTGDQMPSLLLITDPVLEELMAWLAKRDQWKIHMSSTIDDAFAELSNRTYDVPITGPNTSASEDLAFFSRIRKADPNITLIALSFGGERSDVAEAIREHAFSYFTAPFSAEAVVSMIETALNAQDWKNGISILSNRLNWLTLHVSSSKTAAERICQFMRELESNISETERQAIGTAFREMLLNAMEYGGRFDPGSKIELSYVRTDRLILYHLHDPGSGFSLDQLPHSAVSNSEDSPFGHMEYRLARGIRPGGFGILMARQLIDDLLYNEKGNELLLIRYLNLRSAISQSPEMSERDSP